MPGAGRFRETTMQPLRIHRRSLLALQRGMLRRHHYYQALGDAGAYRRLRSHVAGYRAINKRRRALYDLARRDRVMWERLSQWGNRFHSVNDPIEAEVYRLRCELYCALAAGADVEQTFACHYERARVVCERFNAKQTTGLKRSWHPTDAGYFSPDAAWQHLRHAVRMYQQILARL